jgi:hypothetical protein
MKLATRCFPLGNLPYEEIEPTVRMEAKIFESFPYLALLPKIEPNETLLKRTLENIPGIKLEDNVVSAQLTSKFQQELTKLDKAFTQPTKKNLEPYAISSVFLEKYCQLIKKFKPANACINILGPFTVSQILKSTADEQILMDKNFRKLFIQAVSVKALWAIEKIKECCPTTIPVIVLEEPMFGQLGLIKRANEDITIDLVTGFFSKVIEKIKSADGIVAVQCLEKCDWKIPINAGVDIISYDAYSNPNNLTIIPETITEFLLNGGKINWGIIPVINENTIKLSNIDSVSKRLFTTMEILINSGVTARLVYNSALVSVQGNLDNLPLIFAEKAIILASQLSKRIPHMD